VSTQGETHVKKEAQSFTLALADVAELSENIVERVYARCPDATVSQRDGVVYVSFDRQGQTFPTAVVAAVRSLQRLGLRVDRIVADELVTPSEIAARVGRSRESIRLLIEGERGPGKFPPPAEVLGQQRFWRWRDAKRWFAEYEERELVQSSFDAFVAAVNGLLKAGREVHQLPPDEAKAVRQLAKEEALVSR